MDFKQVYIVAGTLFQCFASLLVLTVFSN